jgi:hypothetical protein
VQSEVKSQLSIACGAGFGLRPCIAFEGSGSRRSAFEAFIRVSAFWLDRDEADAGTDATRGDRVLFAQLTLASIADPNGDVLKVCPSGQLSNLPMSRQSSLCDDKAGRAVVGIARTFAPKNGPDDRIFGRCPRARMNVRVDIASDADRGRAASTADGLLLPCDVDWRSTSRSMHVYITDRRRRTPWRSTKT